MMNRLAQLLVAVLGVAALCGCEPRTERREIQFMPDMYRNPAVKAQENEAFLKHGTIASVVPPANTMPVGFTRYPFKASEGIRAGDELENPLPVTREVLETGRKYFNIHCMVCHGATGAGNGLATRANREAGMPIPPSLYTDKIRDWKDGEIYHTITMGQGQMPAYGARIDAVHRWAIVHYVRALGEAARPTEQDLEAVEKLGWDAAMMDNPARPEDPAKLRSVFRLDFDQTTKP